MSRSSATCAPATHPRQAAASPAESPLPCAPFASAPIRVRERRQPAEPGLIHPSGRRPIALRWLSGTTNYDGESTLIVPTYLYNVSAASLLSRVSVQPHFGRLWYPCSGADFWQRGWLTPLSNDTLEITHETYLILFSCTCDAIVGSRCCNSGNDTGQGGWHRSYPRSTDEYIEVQNYFEQRYVR